MFRAVLLLSLLPQGDASDASGRVLSFSAPKRVFPTGNSTARTWGGVYADAFYAIGRGALFGVPGVTAASAPNVTNNHAVLSTDGGQSWRQWYPTSYVNVATGLKGGTAIVSYAAKPFMAAAEDLPSRSSPHFPDFSILLAVHRRFRIFLIFPIF